MEMENKSNSSYRSGLCLTTPVIPSPLGERVGNAPVRGVKQNTTFLSPSSVCAGYALQTPSPRLGRRNYKGFTLIELLVVVLIIGILSAIALPQYQKAVEKARMAEAVSIMNSIQKAAEALCLSDPSYDGETVGCEDADDGRCNIFDIDVESALTCDMDSGNWCRSKYFSFNAWSGCDAGMDAYRCQDGDCDNNDEQYQLSMNRDSLTGSWTRKCFYYNDEYPYSKSVCESFENY